MSPLTSLSMLVLLVVLASGPALLVLLLGRIPRTIPQAGSVVQGNPLLLTADTSDGAELLSTPLVHLTRTQDAAGLRGVALGLRFLPLKNTAPVLKRLARSNDPELQLYAQTVLADGQEKLQQSFLRLRPLATEDSPTNSASFISAALNLLGSPATPASERETILKQVFPVAERTAAQDTTHPRLVFESARLLTMTNQIAAANTLLQRLPKNSPYSSELHRLLAHRSAILHPPPSPATGYAIQ